MSTPALAVAVSTAFPHPAGDTGGPVSEHDLALVAIERFTHRWDGQDDHCAPQTRSIVEAYLDAVDLLHVEEVASPLRAHNDAWRVLGLLGDLAQLLPKNHTQRPLTMHDLTRQDRDRHDTTDVARAFALAATDLTLHESDMRAAVGDAQQKAEMLLDDPEADEEDLGAAEALLRSVTDAEDVLDTLARITKDASRQLHGHGRARCLCREHAWVALAGPLDDIIEDSPWLTWTIEDNHGNVTDYFAPSIEGALELIGVDCEDGGRKAGPEAQVTFSWNGQYLLAEVDRHSRQTERLWLTPVPNDISLAAERLTNEDDSDERVTIRAELMATPQPLRDVIVRLAAVQSCDDGTAKPGGPNTRSGWTLPELTTVLAGPLASLGPAGQTIAVQIAEQWTHDVTDLVPTARAVAAT